MKINKFSVLQKYKSMPPAARAAFWLLLCSVLQRGVQLLTVPIIARMLTPYEYGIFSVFSAYSDIFMIFATLSLDNNGYNVGMKKYSDNGNKYTSSVAALMILITTIVLSAYLILGKQINRYTGLGTSAYALMFIWIYCQGAVSLWYAANRYWFKYRAVVVCTIFTVIATPVLKIVLITVFGVKGIDKSAAAILGKVLPVAMIAPVAWFSMFSKGKLGYVKEYWKFSIAFSIPLIPYYLSKTVLNQADRIMIERMDSASAAGIYSIAYSVAMALLIINQGINGIFVPWQFQKMKQGKQKRVAQVANLLMAVIAAANMLLILVAPEATKLFASMEYYDAIYVIPPVTVGVLLIWITQLFINVEFYYEKNKLLSMSSVLVALLNIALNAIAIPRFGYLAAGYTTLICYLGNTILHGIVAVKLLRDKNEERTFDLGKVTLLIVVSMTIMFVSVILYSYTIIRYFILIVIFAVIIVKHRKITDTIKALINTITDKT